MASPRDSSDHDTLVLLDAVRGGDRAALDELCSRYYGEVQQRVHAVMVQDVRRQRPWMGAMFSTGDIVHDVFLGVLRDLDGFRGGSRAEFVAYLARLTRNRLVDRFRHFGAGRRDAKRVNREVEADSIGAGDEPIEQAILEETARSAHAALETFSERDRALLRGRIEDHESFATLAESLGFASADSARQTFHKLQARFLLRLDAMGGDRDA